MDLRYVYDLTRTVVDNLVTVTLTRPASYDGGAEASCSVNNAQWQPPHERSVDSPLGGTLEGTRGVFRLWQVECLLLPGREYLVPHRGYLITDPDGEVWEIQEVDGLCHGSQYRCHCTRRPS
jgi:hypothetical protein